MMNFNKLICFSVNVFLISMPCLSTELHFYDVLTIKNIIKKIGYNEFILDTACRGSNFDSIVFHGWVGGKYRSIYVGQNSIKELDSENIMQENGNIFAVKLKKSKTNFFSYDLMIKSFTIPEIEIYGFDNAGEHFFTQNGNKIEIRKVNINFDKIDSLLVELEGVRLFSDTLSIALCGVTYLETEAKIKCIKYDKYKKYNRSEFEFRFDFTKKLEFEDYDIENNALVVSDMLDLPYSPRRYIIDIKNKTKKITESKDGFVFFLNQDLKMWHIIHQ